MKRIFAVIAFATCTGWAFADAKSDYDYWTDSSSQPAWMPKSVKTDGQQTYIQFPDAYLLTPERVPSLVVIPSEPGKVRSLRYRVAGSQFVVDAVIEKAMLIGPNGSGRVLIQPKKQTDKGNL